MFIGIQILKAEWKLHKISLQAQLFQNYSQPHVCWLGQSWILTKAFKIIFQLPQFLSFFFLCDDTVNKWTPIMITLNHRSFPFQFKVSRIKMQIVGIGKGNENFCVGNRIERIYIFSIWCLKNQVSTSELTKFSNFWPFHRFLQIRQPEKSSRDSRDK